ncbi:MAG: hypothetical protein GX416_09860 [Bacteroidales bacterium]|nr:hypothetical protein [Bacteroidales bacterium]
MQTKKQKQRKLPAHEFHSKSSGLGLKIHKRSPYGRLNGMNFLTPSSPDLLSESS